MSFEVRFSAGATVDLERLFEFLIDQAQAIEDLEIAGRVIEEVRATAAGQLSRSPFSFRKAGTSPLTRELIIPAGKTGYVALFEIQRPSLVLILAARETCRRTSRSRSGVISPPPRIGAGVPLRI